MLGYNALLLLDRNSIISLSKQFNNKVSVQFIIPNHVLFNYLDSHLDVDTIVKSTLRMYGGIFEHDTNISISKIADKASVAAPKVIAVLKQLEKDNIITLNLANTDAQITFIEPREDDKTINRIALIIEQQNSLKQEQVNAVLKYVKNDTVCKNEQLLSYFGEKNTVPCGICSVCINKSKTKDTVDLKLLKTRIIELLENGEQSSRNIVSLLNVSESHTLKVLNSLLEYNFLRSRYSKF